MLKKSNRISKKSDFEKLRLDGKMFGFSRFFGVVILDKKDEELRFGVVVSKKISKRAVDRNKIRRRIMMVLGKNLNKFKKGQRILFLVKKEALVATVDDFEKEINKICLKK